MFQLPNMVRRPDGEGGLGIRVIALVIFRVRGECDPLPEYRYDASLRILTKDDVLDFGVDFGDADCKANSFW